MTTTPIKIAHFSDLHVLDLEGVPFARFLNKRITGYANLRFKRNHKHRGSYVGAIAREVTVAGIDHVVITGDVTNLALESEFEAARTLLEKDLGLDPHNVTIVPGNHDLYTRGSLTSKRFSTYFGAYMKSDLPELAVDVGVGMFPVVKLRGPAAFIGLSSAVPRLPLVAAGKLGRAQLDALGRVLDHPDVKRRTPVIALHHPAHNPASRVKAYMEGLHDAAALLRHIETLSRGLLLHGHLHTRLHRTHRTPTGHVHAVGATSASLHHDDEARMAGFNVYEIDGAGHVKDVAAHVYDSEKERFHIESVPKHV